MGKSSVKQIRMSILDRMLRSGKKVSFQDVAEKYEKVFHKAKGNESYYHSAYNDEFRQDINDIRKLLKSGIPGLSLDMLIAEGPKKKKLYSYKEKDFSIMPYYGYHYSKYDQKKCDEALSILKENLPEDVYDTVEIELKCLLEQSKSGERLIDYGENPRLRRREWLPRLSKTLNKTAIKIVCDEPVEPLGEHKCVTYDVIPYLLKLYNNRWFLFGRNIETQDDYWHIPVDRIKDHCELDNVELKKRPKNYMDSFQDMIGVIHQPWDGKASEDLNDKAAEARQSEWYKKYQKERIILKVTDIGLLERMKANPLHESQSVFLDFDDNSKEGGFLVLEVIPNVEFYNQLTSLGENIVVYAPESVRDIAIQRLKNTLKNYKKLDL